jgi:hypothetical protein
MENIKREIISPSGKYKATITESDKYYKVDIYTLSEDYDFENGVSYGIYWSRKNDNVILIDKKVNAVEYAIQEIRVLLGEPDSPLSVEWVRDFSFCTDAEFLNPNDIKVYMQPDSGVSQMEAKTIINFSGSCLVEPIDCENNWLMGKIKDNKEINCWAYCGTLKEAIRGL